MFCDERVACIDYYIIDYSCTDSVWPNTPANRVGTSWRSISVSGHACGMCKCQRPGLSYKRHYAETSSLCSWHTVEVRAIAFKALLGMKNAPRVPRSPDTDHWLPLKTWNRERSKMQLSLPWGQQRSLLALGNNVSFHDQGTFQAGMNWAVVLWIYEATVFRSGYAEKNQHHLVVVPPWKSLLDPPLLPGADLHRGSPIWMTQRSAFHTH